MHQIQASIIINTYNRAAYLKRLLPGLGQLRNADFEVVVVNGPSTDDTAALLATYADRIKIVDCPSRNLSHSRNLGIAAAAGEVIVFIDDDALPGDFEWLARYIAAFRDGDQRLGALGGPVWHRDTNRYEFNGGVTSDYGEQLFDQARIAALDADGQRWISGVMGCNCAFRRSAIVEVGGFDEFYTYYLDETDVCMRLARAGYTIAHLPDNSVRHYAANSERRTSRFDRNWRIITRSDTYFALKNGADRPLRRGLRTLGAAPRKHFVREINSYLRNGEISSLHWLRLISAWLSGLISGFGAGLWRARKLGSFHAPPPLRIFKQPSVERRLRVALLSQTLPGQSGNGGIGRYTYDLAQGLHQRGHEVHLFCKDEQLLRNESLGFVVHGLPRTSYAPPRLAEVGPVLNKNLSYAMAVAERIGELYSRGIEFDVVHASNWDAEAAALIRTEAYPTVLMLVSPLAQVIATENWATDNDLRACVAIDRWQIEHADAVCAPSQGVLSSYTTLMGLRADALAHLYRTPLGIVPDNPPVASPTHGRKILLFVGRLERRKGAHTLLAALPTLMASHHEWECHLVGNDQIQQAEGGTLRERFLAEHRGAAWLGRVVFHSTVSESELMAHYRRCDLFVAPSLFESFGLIFHEAMQYGKAVVGCRAGGVPEVVEHGVEGLLVAPDQPAELGNALAQLMDDAALRTRMGAAGRKRIAERSNYHHMAADLEAVYYQTIDRVGMARHARRKQLWSRVLGLCPPSAMVQLEGDWRQGRIKGAGEYCVGKAGASLHVRASGGDALQIEVLRHKSSGVIEVCVEGSVFKRYDLFTAHAVQPNFRFGLVLPGDRSRELEVTLRVHAERNPRSLASEAWLKQIVLAEA